MTALKIAFLLLTFCSLKAALYVREEELFLALHSVDKKTLEQFLHDAPLSPAATAILQQRYPESHPTPSLKKKERSEPYLRAFQALLATVLQHLPPEGYIPLLKRSHSESLNVTPLGPESFEHLLSALDFYYLEHLAMQSTLMEPLVMHVLTRRYHLKLKELECFIKASNARMMYAHYDKEINDAQYDAIAVIMNGLETYWKRALLPQEPVSLHTYRKLRAFLSSDVYHLFSKTSLGEFYKQHRLEFHGSYALLIEEETPAPTTRSCPELPTLSPAVEPDLQRNRSTSAEPKRRICIGAQRAKGRLRVRAPWPFVLRCKSYASVPHWYCDCVADRALRQG